jgi:alanyl aminopeptidase
MLHAVALSFLVASSAASGAESPPRLRLPAGPHPVRQTLELTLDPSREGFEGVTEIELDLPSATSLLWLNATELEVGTVGVSIDGAFVEGRGILEGEDFLGIRLPHPVGPGKARLRIAFKGTASRRNAYGLFARREGGDAYVFSQFEPIGARKAFPCFDEPSYKIPFQVTLRVPNDQEALANTPVASSTEVDGMRVVVFQDTKPLPSYLVAVAVGPFEFVDAGPAGRNKTPTRIVVPRGRGGEARFAKETTPQILALLEDYVGLPYPYEKLDQLAIPGFESAMEHPGLITYAEGLIVEPRGRETLGTKREFAETCAHELAHQWFGNLVTMAWWDDIWLNEAFANWLGAKITNRFHPTWDTKVDEVSARSEALTADSLASARRVREPISSDDDIEDVFDAITYAKGEAILEMFEAWIGEGVFQAGVRSYLNAHAFSTAKADDFVAALSSSAGKSLAGPFASFLDQVGAPLISVDVRCDSRPRAVVSQKPYRPVGSHADPARTWEVPVCLGVEAGNGKRRECLLLTTASAELALPGGTCPQGVVPNAESAGYFRVRAGKGTAALLESGHGSPAETIGLLGDLEALVASDDLPASDALDVAARFAGRADRRLVAAAAHLVERLEAMAPDPRRYADFVLRLFGERAHSLGWHPRPEDDEDTRILRSTLLEAACVHGRDPVLGKEAAVLAMRWLDDPSAIDPDLVSLALVAGARNGDASLLERVRSEAVREGDRGRRERLLLTLGSFHTPELLRSALGVALSPAIDADGAALVLTAASGDRETAPIAYGFLKEHFDALLSKLPREYGASLPSMGASFCDAQHRDDLGAFLRPRLAASPGAPRSLDQAIEKIDLCIAEQKAQGPRIAAYLSEERLSRPSPIAP